MKYRVKSGAGYVMIPNLFLMPVMTSEKEEARIFTDVTYAYRVADNLTRWGFMASVEPFQGIEFPDALGVDYA